MLLGKRQANDGNSQQNAKKQVRQGNPDAAYYDPDHVENGGEAARIARHVPNFAAKRHQAHQADFEALHPKWNAYDGDAEDKTRDHVLDKDDQAAKNEPDDVSYEVHKVFSKRIPKFCIFFVQSPSTDISRFLLDFLYGGETALQLYTLD